MNSSHNVPHGLGDLVGMPVRRLEDDELLRGGARFLDDIRVAGERHAVFVRAQCASAVIEKIETDKNDLQTIRLKYLAKSFMETLKDNARIVVK